jgi:hypothetical protein
MKNLKNMLGLWLACWLALLCGGVAGLVFAQEPLGEPAKELVQKIIDSEKLIHDVELHYEYILKDGHILTSFDWGYEGGKEYYAGYEFQRTKKDDEMLAFEKHVAFDGEKVRRWGEAIGYRSNDELFKGGFWGRVCPFNPDHFIYPRPTTLLGYDVAQGRRSFGEILRDASQVSVRENPGEIDGHSCLVLETIGVVDRMFTLDVLAWIDTQRDYRPLRIEVYHSIPGTNRWQVLGRTIEEIKLEKIDGVWFPIDGKTCAYFTKNILPPEGMTEAEYRRLPREKKREVARYIQEPGEAGTVRVRVKKDTVRINKGIAPAKFTLEFPQGCKVYDDFLQTGYTVGELDRMILNPLEGLADSEPKSKSDSSGKDSDSPEANQPNNLLNKDSNKSQPEPSHLTKETLSVPQAMAKTNPKSRTYIQTYTKYFMPAIVALVAVVIVVMLIRVTTKSK